MTKKLPWIILLLLFCYEARATGLQASLSGSRFTGMTRESTIFESFGDIDLVTDNLIDHSGSNLLTYTESFDNAAWTKTNVTVTADQVRGPGSITANADLLTPTAADSYVYQDATAVVGTQYTCSFDIRTVTGNVNLSIHAYDQAHGAILGTKAILITPFWQRFYVAGVLVAGDTDVGCTIGGNTTWSAGEDIYAVRAQAAENNKWNPGLGVYHPRLAAVTKPILDMAPTDAPEPVFTDLQSNGRRLPGRSYDLGTNYYSIAHHDCMNMFDGDFTMTFYIQRCAHAANADSYFSHGEFDVSGCSTYAYDDGWAFRCNNNGGHSDASMLSYGLGPSQDGYWHVIQMVRDNNVGTIYFDGVPGMSQDFTGMGVDANKVMYLGKKESAGQPWEDGYISYARIDAEALSEDELTRDRYIIKGLVSGFTLPQLPVHTVLFNDQIPLTTTTIKINCPTGRSVHISWGDAVVTKVTCDGTLQTIPHDYLWATDYVIRLVGDYDKITAFQAYSQAIFFGDISTFAILPNLATLYLYSTSCTQYTSTPLPAWAGADIQIQSIGLDATEVDNFLIDLADGCGAGGSLNIAGTNAARTAASDAALATLTAAGWVVTVN